VAPQATNINFGMVLMGHGTAWFDALRVELDGDPYLNPQFDFDFESAALKGFSSLTTTGAYRITLDNTTAYTGRQSLKILSTDAESQPATLKPIGVELLMLDPATVDDASHSVVHDARAPVNFINRSSRAVDIYWIDYDGNRVLYYPNLAAGASWRTSSFVTHPWLAVASGTGATKQHDTGVRVAAGTSHGCWWKRGRM
jgi:hypothetical protein